MNVIVLKRVGNWEGSRCPSEDAKRCTEGRVEVAEFTVVRSGTAVIIRLRKARLLRLCAQVPYLVRERNVLRHDKSGKKGNTRKATKHQPISIHAPQCDEFVTRIGKLGFDMREAWLDVLR
jgi:hypothetical protein